MSQLQGQMVSLPWSGVQGRDLKDGEENLRALTFTAWKEGSDRL